MSSHTLRKNFTMPEYIAKKLEFLAHTMGKKQSAIVSFLIEQEAKKYEKEKKLDALDKLSGIFNGMVKDNLSIQSIKADSEN